MANRDRVRVRLEDGTRFSIAIFLSLVELINPCRAQSVLPVAVYGDVDKRSTEDEFAAAHAIDRSILKNVLSATGTLLCPAGSATAQLTATSDLLTTVAHIIYGDGKSASSCSSLSRPPICVFTYKWNGQVKSIKTEGVEATGYNCGKAPEVTDDWAVVRLSRKAIGPVPYAVHTQEQMSDMLLTGKEVTVLAAHSVDFFARDRATGVCLKGQDGRPIMPRNIQLCHIQRAWSGTRAEGPIYVTSDCDGSFGSSGAALLDFDLQNSTPSVIAIQSANHDDKAKFFARISTCLAPERHPYNTDSWASYDIPVSGIFLAEVLLAADRK